MNMLEAFERFTLDFSDSNKMTSMNAEAACDEELASLFQKISLDPLLQPNFLDRNMLNVFGHQLVLLLQSLSVTPIELQDLSELLEFLLPKSDKSIQFKPSKFLPHQSNECQTVSTEVELL